MNSLGVKSRLPEEGVAWGVEYNRAPCRVAPEAWHLEPHSS